ncbi:Ser/thr protein phosphatase family protein [Entamoeba marina]
MNTRRVFVLSDLHLNLDSVFNITPSYKNRNLKDSKTLREFRKKTFDMSIYGVEWKNHIKLKQKYIFCFKNIRLDLEWVDQRPGKKIIGCGNHDKWWPTTESAKQYFQKRYKTIFFVDENTDYVDDNIVVMGCRMCDNNFNVWPVITKKLTEQTLSVKLNKGYEKLMKIYLSSILERMQKLRENKCVFLMIHHPPFNEIAEENEISKMIVDANPDYCLYGHIHNLGRLYSDEKFNKTEDIAKKYPAIDAVIGKTRFVCASSDLLKHRVKKVIKIDNKTKLYTIVKCIEFIESLYVNSTINKEKYIELCGEEMDKFDSIFAVCGYKHINDFFKEFNLDCQLAKKRCLKGKPMVVDYKIVVNGRLIIDVTENILQLINMLYMELDDFQSMREYINKLNSQLYAFETKDKAFEKVKDDMKDWEKFLGNKDDEILSKEESNDLSIKLNQLMTLFKQIND